MAVLLLLEHIVAADGAILNRNNVAAKTAKPLTVGNVAANGNFGYAVAGTLRPAASGHPFPEPVRPVRPTWHCVHLFWSPYLRFRFVPALHISVLVSAIALYA